MNYFNLLDEYSFIRIDLEWNEKWDIKQITFKGEKALKTICQELEVFDMENIIKFIKRYPVQTF